jgi:hypothetical protein
MAELDSRSKNMKTIAAAVISALALLGLTAGSASAASISYVGTDGNVWLVSPDGSASKQVTTNGSAGEGSYRSPTQKNDGTIAAVRRVAGTGNAFVHFFRPADGAQVDAWNLPKTGAGSFVPFNGGQVSPDGGMYAYDWRFFDCSTNPCQGNQRVSFISGPGTTNPCLINCHVGHFRPRWIPGTPYAGFIGEGLSSINVQSQAGVKPWLQSNPAVETIDSFDVSSTGRTLIETSAPGPSSSNLVLFQNNGTPPNGNPQALCTADGFAGENSLPRWSPDGSMISWKGAGGVYVSPAPTVQGATCVLQPKLVAPGGSEPSWGLANVPAAPPAAATTPTGKKPNTAGKAACGATKGAAAAKKKKKKGGCKKGKKRKRK